MLNCEWGSWGVIDFVVCLLSINLIVLFGVEVRVVGLIEYCVVGNLKMVRDGEL